MRLKFLAALCAALLLSACNEPQTETFTFTAIPDQDESQLEKRFGGVALYLEEQLGVPVKYVPVKSYAAAVTEKPTFSNSCSGDWLKVSRR